LVLGIDHEIRIQRGKTVSLHGCGGRRKEDCCKWTVIKIERLLPRRYRSILLFGSNLNQPSDVGDEPNNVSVQQLAKEHVSGPRYVPVRGSPPTHSPPPPKSGFLIQIGVEH
jgi:hypothetical protein